MLFLYDTVLKYQITEESATSPDTFYVSLF